MLTCSGKKNRVRRTILGGEEPSYRKKTGEEDSRRSAEKEGGGFSIIYKVQKEGGRGEKQTGRAKQGTINLYNREG